MSSVTTSSGFSLFRYAAPNIFYPVAGRMVPLFAVLALVGVINVPIVYFSVKWWNTLHQGASVKPGSSSMAEMMLTAMLVMVFAFWMYAIAAVLARLRAIILERERRAQWVLEARERGTL